MKLSRFSPLASIFFLLFGCNVAFGQIVRIDEVVGKSDPKLNRERGKNILSEIKEVLETYYYDKNFRGIDIDRKFKEANEKIKTLETNAQIFRTIAGVLLEFEDSHTRFLPPGRSYRVEYGFAMQMIGNTCFIVDVVKGSDAEKKGLKIGDVVKKIGQHEITRDNLWAINYFIYALEPMPLLPVTLVGSDGTETTYGIVSTFKSPEQRKKEADARAKEKQENPYKCSTISPALTACKLRSFSVDKKYIDQMMKEATASSKLILDLRGNRGGYIKMEEYLAGHFFDREVKIADLVTRDKKKPSIAKPVKERQFKGDLVVLIDSNSASASEIFARLIQIEKRGKVVGDVSAGAVMTSYNMTMSANRGVPGYETLTLFGLSVTVADLVMSDGNRLEHAGVVPDHPIGPTTRALASRSDPVLAYAANLFGERLSAKNAGKIEFVFKKIEGDDDDETAGDTGDRP